MNDYEYPTDDELQIVSDWDIIKNGTKGLVDYIESIWWAPDWGFKLRRGYSYFPRKRVMKLELHTGGWSGNESIIGSLMENRFFWIMHWRKTTRGGHYWFEIELDRWIND